MSPLEPRLYEGRGTPKSLVRSNAKLQATSTWGLVNRPSPAFGPVPCRQPSCRRSTLLYNVQSPERGQVPTRCLACCSTDAGGVLLWGGRSWDGRPGWLGRSLIVLVRDGEPHY